MSFAALLDPILRLYLRYRHRRRRAEGVLLVSSRGPAEMVFLSAVLPRFMRLAKPDEAVTLLCRSDAAGMSFLFPRFLRLRRVDFRHLDELNYRWRTFLDLHAHHYRLIVSLDYVRHHDQDEAMIIAADPPETAGMVPPPYKRNFHQRMEESEKVFDILFDSGPLRQDTASSRPWRCCPTASCRRPSQCPIPSCSFPFPASASGNCRWRCGG